MVQDYEIFISYRHRECSVLAESLYDYLTSNRYKLDCFRDKEELHFGDFRKQLIKNNRRARYLVLLLTPETLSRCNEPGDWITKEISLFLKMKKPIIPVKIDGFRWPDNLPDEIKDVVKYDKNALYFNSKDFAKQCASLAENIYITVRTGWYESAAEEAKKLKQKLSRTNTGKDSYFYDSARGFRKYFVFFALQYNMFVRFAAFNLPVSSGNTTMLLFFEVFTVFLLILDFDEYFVKNKNGGGAYVSFVDLIMDYPITHAFKKASIGIRDFLPALLIMGGVTLANHFLSGLISGWMGHSNLKDYCSFYGSALIFIGIPLVRFAVKGILQFIHLLNSRLGPYPINYLTYVRVNNAEIILGRIGWVLLIPAIILSDMFYIFLSGGVQL